MTPLTPLVLVALAWVLAIATVLHQRRTIKTLQKHMEHMANDTLNSFEKSLRLRVEAERWKRQAFEANMVIAALYHYPSDDPESELEVDDTDPRSGVGTIH